MVVISHDPSVMEIEETTISTISEYEELIKKRLYKKYCYRGQPDSEYHLEHSLHRYFVKLGIVKKNWVSREKGIRESFQSKAHHYLKSIPANDNFLEWFSIMQHFGAPTRLLDFTYSPYIALFFAAEDLNTEYVVYEIDLSILKKLNNSINLVYQDKQLNRLISNQDENDNGLILFPYEPKIQNERLIAQQGLFIVSNRLDLLTEKIVVQYNLKTPFIHKYIFHFDKKYTIQIIKSLRKMNIDNRTLFPGIEGLSKSMRFSLLDPISYMS